MTEVRTLTTHEIVRLTYPRPVSEKDELGMAVGKAIDVALSRYSHEFSQGRRPAASAMYKFAISTLDEELNDIDLVLDVGQRQTALNQLSGVLRAFRSSEIFGLPRPRTRMILINDRVGVYAQPDYWDGRGRFYEMKSYRAIPPPPDVDLQLRIFQLAFAGFEARLICFNRHSTPVEVVSDQVPPITTHQTEQILGTAYWLGLESGTDKVLEYIDTPAVRYSLSSALDRSIPGSPNAG
jgi:hypothetical protein